MMFKVTDYSELGRIAGVLRQDPANPDAMRDFDRLIAHMSGLDRLAFAKTLARMLTVDR